MADQKDNVSPAPEDPNPMPNNSLVVARNQTMALAFSGLVPQSIGDAMALCTSLAKSDAIPKALRGKAESVLTVVMAGMEIGLTPIRSIQSITNISGNLCMKADLQLALVRRSGLLVYFDEGYEEAGSTDHEGRLLKKLQAARCPDPDGVADLILELTADVPDGKPYGWTVAKRKGDEQLIVRTFTWLDAERAFTWEQDEDNPNSTQRTRKKLSEKFNYQAWPQSMYPRRSRGAVLQTGFSDVLAGMPTYESLEGGQVLDVSPDDYQVGTPADDLLAEMRTQDPESTQGIELAFENMQLANGRQLQLLTKFKGDPKALYLHLRDEYARRQGKPAAAPKKDKAGARAATGPDQVKAPVQDGQVVDTATTGAVDSKDDHLFDVGFEATNGSTTPPARVTTQTTPEPAAPTNDEPATKKPTVSELAARFQSGMPSF